MDREVYAPIVSEETMRKLIKKLDDVSLRSQIVDNLTTASDTKALSANMGKKLQDEKLSIANLASTLGQQTNTAPTNKAVNDAISSLSDAINAISIKTSTGSGTTGNYGEVDTSVSLTKKLICVDMNSINSYAILYHGAAGVWSLKVFNVVSGVEANASVSWTAYYID